MSEFSIGDRMRYNLVTTLVCLQCGEQLMISYEKVSPKYDPIASAESITSAGKVQLYVGVHPCRTCYDKATAPIKALQEALKFADDTKPK